MESLNFSVLVLAAGKGTRMRSTLPKVMHPLAGLPLIRHVLNAAETLNPKQISVLIGEEMADVAAVAKPHKTLIQKDRLGTGHAVQQGVAGGALAGAAALVVLYGDTPLIVSSTIQAMLAKLSQDPEAALVVLGFHTATPTGYGRLVLENNTLQRIVEEKEASEEEKKITFCNAGIMLFRSTTLPELLAKLDNNNHKQEYYLTDTIHHARNAGYTCLTVEATAEEVLGINSKAELAQAENIVQQQLRAQALEQGVTLIAPETVFLSKDTTFGNDVVIEPNVFIGAGVHLKDGVHIKAFSHIEGATIGAHSTVGPFARLRAGTVLGKNVKIGNFVETKKAVFGDDAKASHLSYIGDATVGNHANIGAGTITCNYNGFTKADTIIGEGVFVGSNTALVAPVTLEKGAIIGAGSTITQNVPADSLSLTRPPQTMVTGWAAAFRARFKKEM
jgi:bifunctional UDP-N-acetylglucosamine pyrophosphorylase/glucosamine-1-phosphate N-acetyltransferase